MPKGGQHTHLSVCPVEPCLPQAAKGVFMKSKILLLGILVSFVVNAQNITNTLGTSGIFTIKDNTTTFLSLNQTTGDLTLGRKLILPFAPAGSQNGAIFVGSTRFIHNYAPVGVDGYNTFVGLNSGNFTMIGPSANFASDNTGVGYGALSVLYSGYDNSALGFGALGSNTTGYNNSAFGSFSLISNLSGYQNSAFGMGSLKSNYMGFQNSAFGEFALASNVTGFSNSAFGFNSLYNNNGVYNSAFGFKSLYNNSSSDASAFGSYSLTSNTSGEVNSAFGTFSLSGNTTGSHNSAFGFMTLNANTVGSNNSAFGESSLYSNTTSGDNSAFGQSSLYYNLDGFGNSAFGKMALYNNTSGYINSSFGVNSLSSNTTGYQNSAFGSSSGYTVTTGSNLTLLGFGSEPTTGTTSNQITLGNGFVTSLRCNVTTITSLSDARDKKNIKDLNLGVEFLMMIKPRLFNWDKREWYENNVSDGSMIQETQTAGFIAQELDEVQNSEDAAWLNLVLKDNPEKWEATPGNLLPVMVKAIQELKAENEALKEKVDSLRMIEERIAALEKTIHRQEELIEVKSVER